MDESRHQLMDAARAWLATSFPQPIMAAAYGSVLGRSFDPSRSDLNLLLVQEGVPTDAEAEATQQARVQRLAVFLVTPWELQRFPRLFPVKLHAIRRHYELLSGTDLLRELKPDRNALQRACQVDLQNLALKVRKALLAGTPDPLPVKEALRRFLPKFRDVLRVLFEETGGSPDAGQEEMLGRLALVHGLDTVAWMMADQVRNAHDTTWPEAHEAALRVLQAVEHLLARLDP